MNTTSQSVRLSNEALRQLLRELDTRPAVAWKRDEDAELLAERIRKFPAPSLRQRITVA